MRTILLLFCGIAVLIVGFQKASLAQNHAPTLAIGAAAPDFKLMGVDGKTYTLQNFAKVPVLAVLFTCNHCPTA